MLQCCVTVSVQGCHRHSKEIHKRKVINYNTILSFMNQNKGIKLSCWHNAFAARAGKICSAYHQGLELSRCCSFLVSSIVKPHGQTMIQSQSASTKA